jgi:hypothetical protein
VEGECYRREFFWVLCNEVIRAFEP